MVPPLPFSSGKIYPCPSWIGRVIPLVEWLIEQRKPRLSVVRRAILFRRKRTRRRLRSTRSGNNAETTNNGGGKLRTELKGLSSFMAQCFWTRLIGTLFSYEKLDFSCIGLRKKERERESAQAKFTMNTPSTGEQFTFSINIGYLDKCLISVVLRAVSRQKDLFY